jgi:hypothetical protein
MEKKMSLSKNDLALLTDFVTATFVDVKDQNGNIEIADSKFQESAFRMLKNLCEMHSFVVLKDDAPAKLAKGNNSTTHNSDDDKYVRVEKKGMKCPLLVKPIFSKKPQRLLLRFIVVPDTSRLGANDTPLREYLPVFNPKMVKRFDGNLDKLLVVAASITIGMQTRNNAAQCEKQKLAKSVEELILLKKQAKMYVRLSDKEWQAERAECLADFSEDFVLFIEDQRALVAETKV